MAYGSFAKQTRERMKERKKERKKESKNVGFDSVTQKCPSFILRQPALNVRQRYIFPVLYRLGSWLNFLDV